MKLCRKCITEKPFSDFFRKSASKDGYDHKCKLCSAAVLNDWRARNKDRLRAKQAAYWAANSDLKKSARLKKYWPNLTAKEARQEYQSLFDRQRGLCAICSRTQEELRQALAVDHCHQTGRVRGLICKRCNTGIGYLLDSPEIVRAALRYLEAGL